MSRFVGFGSLLVTLAIGAPVLAQDKDLSPSNDELNQDLDQSLKKEFDEDNPAPPTTAPPPVAKGKSSRFKVTLGLMGAYYMTRLFDVELSYREGLSGGGQFELFSDKYDKDEDGAYDLEDGTGTYRAWIDLGKHIAFTGGFRMARYEDEQTLVGNPSVSPGTGPFTFGNVSFQAGDVVEAKFDMLIADSDFVFRPLNNRWITIDMSVGARYISWESTFTRRNGATQTEVSSKIEGAMPMVGLGLALRPVSILEIFGRVRVGGLDYEVDVNDYDSDEIDDYDIENLEREMRSYEIDVGIKLVFGDHIGLIAGYRLDFIQLERRVDNRDETVEAKSHGVYGGLLIQF